MLLVLYWFASAQSVWTVGWRTEGVFLFFSWHIRPNRFSPFSSKGVLDLVENRFSYSSPSFTQENNNSKLEQLQAAMIGAKCRSRYRKKRGAPTETCWVHWARSEKILGSSYGAPQSIPKSLFLPSRPSFNVEADQKKKISSTSFTFLSFLWPPSIFFFYHHHHSSSSSPLPPNDATQKEEYHNNKRSGSCCSHKGNDPASFGTFFSVGQVRNLPWNVESQRDDCKNQREIDPTGVIMMIKNEKK